ncbi:MAG: penicillin acylase family protein [Symbiobacteriaceae bacterium]|jgi:penicillin amidase|nr:penicillin acylase family protein [Symbiobacteriaceae bacterium]
MHGGTLGLPPLLYTGGIPVLRLFGYGGLCVLFSAIITLATNAPFFKGLTLVTAVAIVGVYVFLRRSQPRRNGSLTLPGLREQVDVYLDDRGVPHIYAKNDHDLYMAQGYVTAQDRLWTMELQRRIASGRLAAIFGEKVLELDRHFRTLGMHRCAEASVPLHSREAIEALEAYAAGVNARIAEGRLPVEFSLLRCRPDPWTPADSVLVGKYAAYYLNGNWGRELFRGKLTQSVGAEKAAELFWLPPDSELLHIIEATPLPDVEKLLDIAAATINETSGTNGWVAGGSKARSGAPLLANDPHLEAGNPAVWYQTHLVGPAGLDVTGVTLPGVPGVVLGHTREIAWGATNLNADCQDVYLERANPANGAEFLFEDRWEPARRMLETIQVRGTQPVQHEVLVSRHGPIIARGEETALALQWTALEPSADLEPFLAMNRARSWEDFRAALTTHMAPAQQFLFAGKDGTIASKAAGKVPVRSHGTGQALLPGWTGAWEWHGSIPFADLPEVVNPPEGYIAPVTSEAENVPLGSGWFPPYRAMRIADRLRGAGDLTIEKMEQLQVDSANYHARSLLQTLLNAVQEGLRQGPHPETLSEREKRAMLLLSGWDCCEGSDSAATLLWHHWYLFLLEGIFRPQMGLALFDRFVANGMPEQVTDRLIHHVAQGGSSLWLDAEGENSLSRIALRSFRRTVGYLSAKHGASPERWRWGKEHMVTFRHSLTPHMGWLGFFLNVGPFPLAGSEVTQNRPGFSQLQPFQVTVAPTWRQVVDLGQPDESRDVCAPGQSGHPLSPHYADQLTSWLKGDLQPQLTRHKTIQTLTCLHLKP